MSDDMIIVIFIYNTSRQGHGRVLVTPKKVEYNYYKVLQ